MHSDDCGNPDSCEKPVFELPSTAEKQTEITVERGDRRIVARFNLPVDAALDLVSPADGRVKVGDSVTLRLRNAEFDHASILFVGTSCTTCTRTDDLRKEDNQYTFVVPPHDWINANIAIILEAWSDFEASYCDGADHCVVNYLTELSVPLQLID
jgi:hypothetical protein